jgi:phosphoribosylamine-glycine ligase
VACPILQTVLSAGLEARLYGRQDACRYIRTAVECIQFDGAHFRRDIAAKAF